MQILKYIVIVLIAAAIIGGLVFGALQALQRVDTALAHQQRTLDLLAIQDCAMAYRQETTNALTGQTISRPMEQQVRECAWQKGVEWDGVWSDLPASPAATTIRSVAR